MSSKNAPALRRGILLQVFSCDGVDPLAGAEPGQAEEHLADVVEADADVDGDYAES